MRGFRRRRRLPAPGPWARLALVLLALYLGGRLVGRVLGPLVAAVADVQARAIAFEAVNRVVMEQVVGGVSYADLIHYETDAAGNVTVLQTNTPVVNRLAARAVQAFQAELARTAGRRFYVPLGDFLGNPFLAGSGPRIPISFIPVGAVTANLRQQFEAAGINQTRHLVLVELEAHVRVVIPLVAREVTVRAGLPLAETIIAGRVPQSYWLGGSGTTVVPGPGFPPGARRLRRREPHPVMAHKLTAGG